MRPFALAAASLGTRAALRFARGGHLLALRPQLFPNRHARPAVSLQTRVRAAREWPNPDFIEETKAAFPEKGIADVEEARVLFSSGGYTYLDVRTEVEVEDAGRVRGSVHIPLVIASRVWDPQEQKKVVEEEPNEDWLSQVERRFPDRGTPLLVCCADGRHDSVWALEELEAAGYTCLVGLKGGYAAWSKVFDNKLARRRSWAQAAEPSSPAAATAAAEVAAPRRQGSERDRGRPSAREEDPFLDGQAEVEAVRAALERAVGDAGESRRGPPLQHSQAEPSRGFWEQPAALPALAAAPARQGQWPDPAFIADVKARFPDRAVANTEEGRVLLSEAGYTLLDVRSEAEAEEGPRVRGSVGVPYITARYVYNARQRRKVLTEEPNLEFVQQVQRQFPDKATPLLVSCATGKRCTLDALLALDDAGYRCLVGLKGGLDAFNEIFDSRLNRRSPGALAIGHRPGAEYFCMHAQAVTRLLSRRSHLRGIAGDRAAFHACYATTGTSLPSKLFSLLGPSV